MPLINFYKPLSALRVFLGKTGLLPSFTGRSSADRRVLKDRRTRSNNEYLITEGADRRFQPDRRNRIERRAGTLTIEDLDIRI
ncbi:MAG: hypothetical protein WC799_03260 [Desulfobacteraceae bacterium]